MSINPREGFERFACADVDVFYMAVCHECDMALPFGTRDERDDWAACHRSTGHWVREAVDVRAHAESVAPDTLPDPLTDRSGWASPLRKSIDRAYRSMQSTSDVLASILTDEECESLTVTVHLWHPPSFGLPARTCDRCGHLEHASGFCAEKTIDPLANESLLCGCREPWSPFDARGYIDGWRLQSEGWHEVGTLVEGDLALVGQHSPGWPDTAEIRPTSDDRVRSVYAEVRVRECLACDHPYHGQDVCNDQHRDVYGDEVTCMCRGLATCPECGDQVQARALIPNGRGRLLPHADSVGNPCSGSNRIAPKK